jgi:hypothetical protein
LPGGHHKELNPYWKDGGSGLPTTSADDSGSVEGRSWILRSYKRALERVEKEGKSFEEIAQKQWGSVEKIYSLLKSVGIDPKLPDVHVESSSGGRNTSLPIKVTRASSHSKFVRPGDKESNTELYQYGSSEVCTSQPEADPRELFSGTMSDDSVTEAMINSTSAKLIKAELVGNKEKSERLKVELEDLRSRIKKKCQKVKSAERTVLLTKADRFGHVTPAVFSAGKESKGKSKRIKDEFSLNSLVEMEHRTTAEDTYEAIANMASKFVRSTRDDIVDDVLDTKFKLDSSKEDKKMKLKILTESRRVEDMMDKCKFCLNTPNFNKHVLIAMGINVYLSVPPYQSLCDGHCLIIPLEHVKCSMHMDENVWSEVKIFQKGLSKMFTDNNMDVIFTECYSSTARRSHMYIDCIPIPKKEGSMAPMYFKKAILESDVEWSDNKKLIDTRQKGLKKSIPVGLPYFYVDFNNEGGFAHVIEDSSLFPHYFGKEVVGGLIDSEPRLWLKPPYETFEQQRSKALKVLRMWKPYDWTNKINE